MGKHKNGSARVAKRAEADAGQCKGAARLVSGWAFCVLPTGHAGEHSGVPVPRKHFGGPSGKTELIQCRVYLSATERDEQYAAAKLAGVSWSTWARRKLATK